MGILDDDSIVHLIVETATRRAQIVAAIERAGGAVCVHSSLQDFLAEDVHRLRGCALIEVPLGRAADLAPLWKRQPATPVIVISAHGDVDTAVEVMKRGAFDCFEHSLLFEDDFLMTVVAALRRHAENWLHLQRQAELRGRVESLTARERQVMSLLAEGTLNKIIASRLGLSRRTVETHRSNVMVKMQATSVAQLINMSLSLAKPDQRAVGAAPVWRRYTPGRAADTASA